MAKGKATDQPIFVDLNKGGSTNNVEDIEATVVESEIPKQEIKEEPPKEEQPKEEKPKRRSGKARVESKSNESLSSKETQSEILNVDELKEGTKKENITIDFMNQDESEQFIEKKTKSSKLTSDLEDKFNAQTEDRKSEFEGKSTQEIRDQILKEEEEKSNSFKPSDYEEIAKMLVNIIDMLMSSLLKWFAKDTSDTAYSLNAKKKDTVSYQLTLIMIKHQKKWSIELMFILTVIAVYSGPFLAARSHRKKVKEKEANASRGKGKPQKH